MSGFTPPPLVWETLGDVRAEAERHPGGAIDLTIGTPTDPPPPAVVAALGGSGQERGYPPSIGSAELRAAASDWMARRLGATVPPEQVAATVGSKELVAGVPMVRSMAPPGWRSASARTSPSVSQTSGGGMNPLTRRAPGPSPRRPPPRGCGRPAGRG